MKKVMFVLAVMFMAACGGQETTTNTVVDSSSVAPVSDSVSVDTVQVVL